MEQKFLEQISKQGNKRVKKRIFITTPIFFALIGFLWFALKDSLDMSDYKSKKVVACLVILMVIMLVSIVVAAVRRTAKNGGNLKLPFEGRTKQEASEIINREIAEGKVQVDEYIYDIPKEKKPYGERVILIPSYLLLCHDFGAVTAIPRDKIYWLCAQAGVKGRSPYIVRLLIFTEKKTFEMVGVEPEHVEKIADKIYDYIPNVFSEYDPFKLSYSLEELFDQNREAFLRFYEEEKKKTGKQYI